MAEPFTTRFEADLAAALNGYAEAAPMAADPVAVTRAAATAPPRGRDRLTLDGWRVLRPALLLAALLALLIAMLLVTGSSPRPGGAPWVAYQAPTYERSNAHALQLIRTDGTGKFFAGTNVTGGEQLHPDWSHDGRRIVLDALDLGDTDGTYDIWIVDTSDWSADKVVTCDAPCLYAQEPAWSPDDRRIAFQRHTMTDAGEISSIEILDLETREVTKVYETSTTEGVSAPRWSPDGASLVFERVLIENDAFAGVSLEILDLATPGTTHQLTPVEMFANNPDWSRTPDGELILFSAPAEGGDPGGALSDIWVVKPDGTGLGRVTDAASHGGTAIKATFSPDGSRIVFLLDDPTLDASNAMASIAIDGTDLRSLVGDADWMFGYHARLQP